MGRICGCGAAPPALFYVTLVETPSCERESRRWMEAHGQGGCGGKLPVILWICECCLTGERPCQESVPASPHVHRGDDAIAGSKAVRADGTRSGTPLHRLDWTLCSPCASRRARTVPAAGWRPGQWPVCPAAGRTAWYLPAACLSSDRLPPSTQCPPTARPEVNPTSQQYCSLLRPRLPHHLLRTVREVHEPR